MIKRKHSGRGWANYSSSLYAPSCRIPRSVLLTLLHAYKFVISPLFPPACRYVPTCSEYAAEAIHRHGAIRGSAMAAWRLLRCHPFVRGGFDPVPVLKSRTCSGGPPGPTIPETSTVHVTSH